MFPFDLEDSEVEVEIEEDKEPSDYEIDFNSGTLTGKIITGLKAIEQWIRLTLGIDRYFYPQYSWDCGSELNTLIGQGYSQEYIESEVKRMLEDALLINDNIEAIEDINCLFDDTKLTVTFTVNTPYGRSEAINV